MPNMSQYRLDPSAYVEPLVNEWSAWASLMSPLTAGLHARLYQLPLLRSYIANPEQHLRASEDPALAGAPFASIPLSNVSDMKRLLAESESRLGAVIALAEAVTTFSNELADTAKGESLISWYTRLPQPMRGFVELVYDYQHGATVRVIEPLLYRSAYYDAGLQTLRCATLEDDRTRAHFLNTPRLEGPGSTRLDLPFCDSRVDDLFRLDVAPQPMPVILDTLGLPTDALDGLLTDAPAPPPPVPWTGDPIRVKYFGHATVLLERRGVSVLSDPVIAAAPRARRAPRFSFADLPASIDYVVITHAHQDHFHLETLLRLRHRVRCIVVPRATAYLYGDLSLKRLLETIGFRHVVEADALDELPLDDGAIVAVPFLGEHSDVGHSKSAYVVRMGQVQMLLAADSDCLDVGIYENVRECLGPVDTVFLGLESVGAPMSFSYGSLFPRPIDRRIDETRRQNGCSAERGAAILDALGASRFYNYAMGLEPWMAFILGFSLTPDSPQWRESDALLQWARMRRFSVAERLHGSREFLLSDAAVPRMAFSSEAMAPAGAVDDFTF